MVFSNDNLKGFVPSLLSSGFIGSSFVIKKKGLRRAAVVSGVRAGVGGYTYLLEPLWWIGMITSIGHLQHCRCFPNILCHFTSLTILASVIMFKDWEGQSAGSIMSEICGFIVVLSGTMLLHATKDFERSSSFRGNYTPLSPTLSTRLCSGNGEFLAYEVEEQDCPCDEEACIRRQ